jgi:hypothetical protein
MDKLFPKHCVVQRAFGKSEREPSKIVGVFSTVLTQLTFQLTHKGPTKVCNSRASGTADALGASEAPLNIASDHLHNTARRKVREITLKQGLGQKLQRTTNIPRPNTGQGAQTLERSARAGQILGLCVVPVLEQ